VLLLHEAPLRSHSRLTPHINLCKIRNSLFVLLLNHSVGPNLSPPKHEYIPERHIVPPPPQCSNPRLLFVLLLLCDGKNLKRTVFTEREQESKSGTAPVRTRTARCGCPLWILTGEFTRSICVAFFTQTNKTKPTCVILKTARRGEAKSM